MQMLAFSAFDLVVSAVMVAAALFSGLVGIIMLAWGASCVRVANASRRWPSCPGVIIESRVCANRELNGMPGWQPVIRYRYSIAGEVVDSDADEWRAGDFRYYTRRAAQCLADRYPVGAKVEVRYDPQSLPVEAGGGRVTVLRPGWDAAMTFVVMVMVLAAALPLALVTGALVRLF